MRNSGGTKGRTVFARVAVLGLVSGAIAGCSSDVSRFGSASGPNGAYPQPPEVTGSLGAGRPGGQGYGAPGYGAQQTPYNGNPGYSNQGYGGAAASYAPPNPGQQGYGNDYGMSAGATRVATHVVEPGETLSSVARRYNMDPSALGVANNIAAGNTVRTGQTLIIPQVQSASPFQSAAVAPAATAAAGTGAALSSAARGTGTPPTTLGAQAAAINPGAQPPLPSSRPAVAAATAKPLATPAAAPVPVTASVAKPVSTSTIARADVPAPAAASTPAPAQSAAAEADDEPRKSDASGPQFRAPVRGRVIASFGPKPGGTRNEGVNFAVPEGTSVRAAEDGVVAYSGNELKGYGNLVLVKHSDGYVTAYAHNSELTVKRGDTVRRGQIIAKAGQSGNVQTPQLHFEIRKGSKAVDPAQYVAGL